MTPTGTIRIDALLSARLFLAPQWVGERIYFISNLAGRLGLYAMDQGGSVPEPLLPPHLALQNPELIGGLPYRVFPEQGRILVMIDRDGDENYQPMIVPIGGGFPEPAFGPALAQYRCHCMKVDEQRGIVYLNAESRTEQLFTAYRGRLGDGSLEALGTSRYGCEVAGFSEDHGRVAIVDVYTMGDHVLYLWEKGAAGLRLVHGVPLDARAPGQEVHPSAIANCHFTPGGGGLLFTTALFSDSYGLGYIAIDPGRGAAAAHPGRAGVSPVELTGAVHEGAGELTGLEHLAGDRYAVAWNIDGCDWLYEGTFDEGSLRLSLDRVVLGRGELANGVKEGTHYDPAGDRWIASFSTATSPTQIHRIEGTDRRRVSAATRERILGIPRELLSPGEDASFTSHDGLRVSARLYLPAPALGFEGRRPVVYYVHGGPQSQERPNFAWFSMPLIQFLALSGFAVFVPNARGSTGYGLGYTKRVDRDWGGQDRLDHVHAMTKVLPLDGRLDAARAGVVGRSYGGYMTLTLAGRHPELWSAAVDMFGPFDLFTFLERLPATWKPYFEIALGTPEKDRDLLVDRSPKTHLPRMACPMLVIQGKNDPRVVEQESRDLVEHLRSIGKSVEYLVFENEGHDVLKFENRVVCYNAITDFFRRHLRP